MKSPSRRARLALWTLTTAFALVLGAGCEAGKIPAAVACTNACQDAARCGEPDCWNRCMATSADLQIFASCTTCITAAGEDCEWRSRCLSTCDGRALESPECVGLCTGIASACAGAASCMDRCVALDTQTRNRCLTCVELRGMDCEAYGQCPECQGGALAGLSPGFDDK